MPHDLHALDVLHLRHDGPIPEDLRLSAAIGGQAVLRQVRARARAGLYERLLRDQAAAAAAARNALLYDTPRSPDRLPRAADLCRAVRALPALRRAALTARQLAEP